MAASSSASHFSSWLMISFNDFPDTLIFSLLIATFTLSICTSYSLFNSSSLAIILNEAHLYSCLLYTSPSPRDRQKSRMPSSACKKKKKKQKKDNKKRKKKQQKQK
eukprot:TRINITY_DN2657_c0_g1_i1.p1 TRINITY_DN2657_c0_g1~~TRINITY_DN2657_c0_g1_i1.p1  ORF type:complete len:106 (+),score=17.36 TRINITY_DN2657_c0_g1_i1:158-475(+)